MERKKEQQIIFFLIQKRTTQKDDKERWLKAIKFLSHFQALQLVEETWRGKGVFFLPSKQRISSIKYEEKKKS